MEAIDLSALAYEAPGNIEAILGKSMENFKWIENKITDTQVFICENEEAVWVTFRGTEFDNLNDWATNLDCRFRMTPWGAVHKGFRDDVESVEFDVGAQLVEATIDNKKIIISGHSQGAADAEQFMMKRCDIFPDLNQLCIAIAPPRSMSKIAAYNFGVIHWSKVFHIINNNDVVTRMLPRFMGYNHTFDRHLRYLDENGKVHSDISWW